MNPMTFEDLEGWQQARQLTRDVYTLTRKDQVARDFGLCGQIQRAAVSTMSNVAGIFAAFSGWDGAGGERAFRVKAVGLG